MAGFALAVPAGSVTEGAVADTTDMVERPCSVPQFLGTDAEDPLGTRELEVSLRGDIAHGYSRVVDRMVKTLVKEEGITGVIREDREVLLVATPTRDINRPEEWVARYPEECGLFRHMNDNSLIDGLLGASSVYPRNCPVAEKQNGSTRIGIVDNLLESQRGQVVIEGFSIHPRHICRNDSRCWHDRCSCCGCRGRHVSRLRRSCHSCGSGGRHGFRGCLRHNVGHCRSRLRCAAGTAGECHTQECSSG